LISEVEEMDAKTLFEMGKEAVMSKKNSPKTAKRKCFAILSDKKHSNNKQTIINICNNNCNCNILY